MPTRALRYWLFDVLPERKDAATRRILISFFDETLATGHAPYIDLMGSLIGFGDPARRKAQFFNRGRNQYWEPWLVASGTAVRLGPLFGFSETRCVVIEGNRTWSHSLGAGWQMTRSMLAWSISTYSSDGPPELRSIGACNGEHQGFEFRRRFPRY